MKPVKLSLTLCFAALLALSACKPNLAATPPDDKTIGVPVIGIHHYGRGHHIGEFFVDGKACGNAGGPDKNSGANTMCSINLPAEWQPGIKTRVRWWVSNWQPDLSGLDKNNPGQWYEADAEVERYNRADECYVNFFPGSILRVVPSPYGPDDTDTRPDQTPPLTEMPVYEPSWYDIGLFLARQNHGGLEARWRNALKDEQEHAKAYFAFLERWYRSRKLPEAEIQALLAKEKDKETSEIQSGYKRYLLNLMKSAGVAKATIEKTDDELLFAPLDRLDQEINRYQSLVK